MASVTSFLDMLQPLTPIVSAPAPSSRAPQTPTETGPDLAALLVNARAEASKILADARRDADEMREDGRAQAEAMREAAWQEGKHDGEVTARADVAEELRGEWVTYRDGLREDFQTLANDIVVGRTQLWERQENDMLELVLTIARQVIKTEVKQNPDVVMAIIRNALRRVVDKENVRIRVSMPDSARVRGAKEDIMSIVDGLRHLEIVDDRRVGEGGCVIETNAGTIDAKIETQLAEVERRLIQDENSENE
jgi:flagellar assembly protein FliH